MEPKKAKYRQAEKIIAAFGSKGVLAKAIGRAPSSIHKWTYPPERDGTDGLVPASAVSAVIAAADLLGIKLTPEHWQP